MLHLIYLLCALIPINCEIINRNVHTTLDIRSQHVKINTTILMQNNGSTEIDRFLCMLDPNVHDFYVTFKNERNLVLKHKQNLRHEFLVYFHKKIAPGETVKVSIEQIALWKRKPIGTSLMSIDQYVLYTGNLYFYSAFKTLSLTTIYVGNFESSMDLQVSHSPSEQSKRYIKYHHQNVTPFSFELCKIAFKDSTPCLSVHKLERTIDVSHYGKIHVEDRVTIKNEGRKFIGPYQHHLASAQSWWYTHLPAYAENIRYFDEIGNSSKSIILHFNNYKMLKFKPRYPLLNGWKTFYIVKYELLAFHYLYRNVTRYALKMTPTGHILNDVVIKEAIVKIVLPATVNVVNVKVPDKFERLEDERRYGTLSTFERPAVVLKGNNIYENWIDDFLIEYMYLEYYLLIPPVILTIYLESMFVFVILLFHIKDN